MKALDLQTEASYLLLVKIANNTDKEIVLPQSASILEDAFIEAIEAYSVSELPLTPNGNTVVNPFVLSMSFLNLRDKESGRDDLYQIPLVDARRTFNNGGFVERFKPVQIDISQSKITIANPAAVTVGEYFAIRFYYRPLNKCKK